MPRHFPKKKRPKIGIPCIKFNDTDHNLFFPSHSKYFGVSSFSTRKIGLGFSPGEPRLLCKGGSESRPRPPGPLMEVGTFVIIMNVLFIVFLNLCYSCVLFFCLSK